MTNEKTIKSANPALDIAIDRILAYRPKPKPKNIKCAQKEGVTAKECRLVSKKAVSGKV